MAGNLDTSRWRQVRLIRVREEGTSRPSSSLGSPCSIPPTYLHTCLTPTCFIDLIMVYTHECLLSARDLTLTCGFTKVSSGEQGT